MGSGCGWSVLLTAEKLKLFENHLELGAFLVGVLVLPLVEAKATFDVEGATLGDVLGDGLALFAPGFDVHKDGLFALLAGFEFEFAGDSEAELADGRSLGCDAEFGVAGEISNEDDFVDGGDDYWRRASCMMG